MLTSTSLRIRCDPCDTYIKQACHCVTYGSLLAGLLHTQIGFTLLHFDIWEDFALLMLLAGRPNLDGDDYNTLSLLDMLLTDIGLAILATLSVRST